jgi:hypothetical protein
VGDRILARRPIALIGDTLARQRRLGATTVCFIDPAPASWPASPDEASAPWAGDLNAPAPPGVPECDDRPQAERPQAGRLRDCYRPDIGYEGLEPNGGSVVK